MTKTPPHATIQAGCKINLSLTITAKLENGYHTLDSIFWPLTSPCDYLDIYLTGRPDFSMSCDTEGIDLKNNTLTKAYTTFVNAGGKLSLQGASGLHVHLRKGIPHGAGLGGGSSDAASLLMWCNAHTDAPLSEEILHRCALSVGADVPFFLYAAPARVQGIGEIITPLEKSLQKKISGLTAVVLCPDINISTPWAYAAFDEMLLKENMKKNTKKKLTKPALSDKYIFACAGKHHEAFHNDFECAVFAVHPALAKLKEELLQKGADFAMMSGSGSSIVGIVKEQEQAKCLAQSFHSAQCKVFTATL